MSIRRLVAALLCCMGVFALIGPTSGTPGDDHSAATSYATMGHQPYIDRSFMTLMADAFR